jgi:hypothetical protein
MVVNEKVPSPTPPHKGEGLTVRPSPHSFSNSHPAATSPMNATSRQSSPSPLWGGVGEGFLP